MVLILLKKFNSLVFFGIVKLSEGPSSSPTDQRIPAKKVLKQKKVSTKTICYDRNLNKHLPFQSDLPMTQDSHGSGIFHLSRFYLRPNLLKPVNFSDHTLCIDRSHWRNECLGRKTLTQWVGWSLHREWPGSSGIPFMSIKTAPHHLSILFPCGHSRIRCSVKTTKAFSLFNEIQQSLSLLQRNKRFLDPWCY